MAQQKKPTTSRGVTTKLRHKVFSVVMSVILVLGISPGFALAQGAAPTPDMTLTTENVGMEVQNGATLESVLAAIGELSNDPRGFSASDADSVEGIWADYEALSAEDQATVDNTFNHPSGDGQSYGRVLEAALWAVRSYSTDVGTTLADGTYTPESSVSDKGKSDSSRVRNWWVESVVVENGQATANIYVTSGAATAGKLTSYPSVWIGGQTIPRAADNTFPIPVDLNGTTYFGGISSSMPRPIMYTLQTTIDEPDIEEEAVELTVVNNAGNMFSVDDEKKAVVASDGSTVALPMKSTTNYVEAYVGTYAEAAAATSTIAIAEDKTFTLPMDTLRSGEPTAVSFKADSWQERIVTVNLEAKTITINESAADYTAVNAAIEAAPTKQGSYTDSSWTALQAAINAVVTGKFASQQAEVDAMAQAIRDAIDALQIPGSTESLADGVYQLPGLEAGPSAMFNHFIDRSRVLIVDGDKATVKFTTDGSTASIQKYTKLALGKSSELVETSYQASLPEGTTIIDGALVDADGSGTDKYTFEIELPKADIEAMLADDVPEDIYIVLWNKEGSSADKIPGWYKPGNDIYLKLGTEAVPATTQDVAIPVVNAKTGEAIAGATVTVSDSNETEAVPSEGLYTLEIGATYSIAVAADGFRTATANFTPAAGESIKALSIWPLDYHYWMQVRGTQRIAEQTDSLHNKGEVVKIKAAADAEATVVEPPTGTYYEFHDLQVGETYTISVDAPEGYALVTTREWSVPDHGYVNETDGETHWETTFTVTDEKEFLGNLIVYFVEYEPESNVDWTAVDNALAKVPGQKAGKLSYFTEESAAPVTAAVNAVDRSSTDQEAVDGMAAAIEDSLKGLVPKDGRYEVTFDKANSTPYYVYEGLPKSTKTHGVGVLVVENGEMSLEAVVQGSSYGYARVGTKDEAIAAAPDANTPPAGTITLTENAVDSANRDVVLPVAKFNEQLQYAYHSSNLERYDWLVGWYDHGLIFRANSVTSLEEEGPLELTITNNTGMFKAETAYVETDTEGNKTLVMALSGTGYQILVPGTYEQAVAGGDAADNWIRGYQNAAGKLEFRIPLEEGVSYMPMVAVSNSYYTKYQDGQNPLERAFYPRQLEVDLEAATLTTGDYEFSKQIAVTNNVKMFKPGDTATLECVGGPNSNNYAATLVLPMQNNTMIEAFVGTYDEAVAASSTIVLAEGNTFSIPVKWVETFGDPTTAVSLANGEPFYLSFKSDKSWYERIATLDEEAGTLVFDTSAADYAAVEAAQAKAPTKQGSYTDASWQRLQEALAAVKTGRFKSQQAEVDAMAKAIEDAVAGLVNPSALNASIKAAQDAEKGISTADPKTLVPGTKYVPAAQKKALDNAIDAAKKVAGKADATQAEVDAAKKAVDDAKAAFNKAVKTASTDKAALNKSIKAASDDAKTAKTSANGKDVAHNDKWVPAATAKALANSIAAAQKVAANKNATQKQIDAAKADVDAKKAAFDKAKKAGSRDVWHRLSGQTRYSTMQTIVKSGWKATGGTVIVATGKNFPDALSAAGIAGIEDAPILITDSDSLTAETKAELQRLKPKKVIIAGGPAAVSANTANAIRSTTGVTPTRLYGATATATAAELNKAYKGKWAPTAIVATRKSFADALSAAPISYAKHYPIFLTETDGTISKDVVAAMKACGIKNVIVVGGTGAVPNATVSTLAKNGISMQKRLGGATRYETSAQIANWGLANGLAANNMGVATGQNFPDALCGAALTGKKGSVLVLADDSNAANAAVAKAKKASIGDGYVYGGEAVVGTKTWSALEAATK